MKSELEDHGESLEELEEGVGTVLGKVHDIWKSFGNYFTNTETTEDPAGGPTTDGQFVI